MTPSLFAWQRAVIATRMPENLRLTALRICLDSSETSGREVVINDSAVADDLGCSVRTVWRRVQSLIEQGWLVQTAKPTYGGAESKGRRARYQLLIPNVSPAKDEQTMADDTHTVACQDPEEVGKRVTKSPANTSPVMSHDYPSRLPNQPQSSANTTPDRGTVLASDGSSTAAAAGDVSIEILASRLRQTTALAGLRTDKLKPAQAERIVQLIEQHGDQRLVDQALLGLRRDNPPLTIQAFLTSWENMPVAGQHLALVKDPPCLEPGHSGTTKHCIQCASERLEISGR